MSNVLTFTPRPQKTEETVEKWEVDMVYDLIKFCEEHGFPISWLNAIEIVKAIEDMKAPVQVHIDR